MSLRGFFASLVLGSCYVRTGSGSPESSVTAPVGSVYLRTDGAGGTCFWVKESGSGNTGWVAMASASSNSGHLQKATVTLTDAQIKALPTTPITLVAAPGSGLQIVPHLWVLRPKLTAGAYTNIHADAHMSVEYASGALASGYLANAATTTPVLTKVSTLLDDNNWTTVLHPYVLYTDPAVDEWGVFPQTLATGDLDNRALQLTANNQGSGAFTGGNGSNTMPITTYYTVEPV